MKSSNTDWVNVRYEEANRSTAQKNAGVTVRFMTSPLDVPDMWRHVVQPTSSGGAEFIFEFKYLAAKEPLRSFVKDGVKLEVGKNSKRVYRIVIPITEAPEPGKSVEFKIQLVVDEFRDLDKQADLRPTHWGVIKGMLEKPNLQMA
ncbi:hypothetical protein [Alcaligenes endophyticus]|uniref:Uncharacterized protein n=1 Tax=Alcaligenes endophyticus TaxID=1929088 RepID=A0ABT8EKD8_9BURK|nr:hypothetical protein [Alcaligenes endophyticus]MCX5590895.1 hypothetical protein [Alcaligenes endophyticus]MDN4121743.1 hypothetical protein [Alcaligenes endophyticus]